MKWGSFGIVHIATLIFAVLWIVLIHATLKYRSQKTQVTVLGLLSLSGIISVVWNMIVWGSPIEYLPLHLCALNAIILPVAVFSRNKVLCNLLLVWALGALAAVVVNTAQAEYELASWTFAMYFFPHVLEFGIPVLMFSLGLVEKHPKYIISTVGITIVTFTLVHFANLGINSYCETNQILNPAGNVIKVNYMYSLVPENPVFELFWNLIPCEYWYLYLIVPILVAYLGGVYLPDIIRANMVKGDALNAKCRLSRRCGHRIIRGVRAGATRYRRSVKATTR